jgi:hypothetical protein
LGSVWAGSSCFGSLPRRRLAGPAPRVVVSVMLTSLHSLIKHKAVSQLSVDRRMPRQSDSAVTSGLTQLKGSYDLQVVSTRARHCGKLQFGSLLTPYERSVPEHLGQSQPLWLPSVDITSTMSGARQVSGRSRQM